MADRRSRVDDVSEPDGATPAADGATSDREARTSGPGRLLVAVYAVFFVAAGSRAAVQLATKFHVAPVAYLLSAVAAVVYLLATVALARGGAGWRRTALLTCSFELLGVLVVGTWSVFDTAEFPDSTVWSVYGDGYGFIPLVLPMIGLYWLYRTRPGVTPRTAAAGS